MNHIHLQYGAWEVYCVSKFERCKDVLAGLLTVEKVQQHLVVFARLSTKCLIVKAADLFRRREWAYRNSENSTIFPEYIRVDSSSSSPFIYALTTFICDTRKKVDLYDVPTTILPISTTRYEASDWRINLPSYISLVIVIMMGSKVR